MDRDACPLPLRDGVGASTVGLPAGPWATWLDFFTERFPDIAPSTWRDRMARGDVRDEHRSAAFVCAAALVLPDGHSAAEVGHFPGVVAREPRGQGGFGYDPVFVPSDQPLGAERSLAEYSAEEKNAVSHRSLAFRALVPHLKEHLRP